MRPALVLAALPLVVRAQKSGKLPRVGLLIGAPSQVDTAFVQGLGELGLVDGRTIVIERRSADGDYERLPALAAELVQSRPQVIASIVTQASIAAKEATTSIPIVIVAVGDPVGAGIVGNLARSGGNVTGTAVHAHDAVGKQVELMRQVLPRIKRVVVLWNPANIVFQQQSLGEALISAARMRIVAEPVGVRSREDLERTFAAFGAEPPDALLVLSDPLMSAHRARIAELAIANRLPAFTGFRLLTEAGILASYGPDLRVSAKARRRLRAKDPEGREAGGHADRAADQVRARRQREDRARRIGITIPASVLARADDVIR